MEAEEAAAGAAAAPGSAVAATAILPSGSSLGTMVNMSDAIERDEWLLIMGILGDIRAELEALHDFLRGAEDGEAEDDS